MRKIVITLAVMLALMALSAGSAGAHVITVTNPRTGVTVTEGWVGADSAAHTSGLVAACMATWGNGAVSISAPWNAALNPCKHFGS